MKDSWPAATRKVNLCLLLRTYQIEICVNLCPRSCSAASISFARFSEGLEYPHIYFASKVSLIPMRRAIWRTLISGNWAKAIATRLSDVSAGWSKSPRNLNLRPVRANEYPTGIIRISCAAHRLPVPDGESAEKQTARPAVVGRQENPTIFEPYLLRFHIRIIYRKTPSTVQ